jgi:hypothetical protein
MGSYPWSFGGCNGVQPFILGILSRVKLHLKWGKLVDWIGMLKVNLLPITTDNAITNHCRGPALL